MSYAINVAAMAVFVCAGYCIGWLAGNESAWKAIRKIEEELGE
jgi:hypothetical protein